MPFCAGGAASGFFEISGSRLGGFTAPRGSPSFSGTCWIPGSLLDGAVGALPGSIIFSGMVPGSGPRLSAGGDDGSPSAA